ncbi:MAG TPA: acylphosphatase [Desulfuromonadaceae bacterium]
MNIRVSVVVNGRVQGVAFRHFTVARALDLGVCGWVRNLPDGSVEGLFEGAEPRVNALVEWCRQGPPSARVDRLEVHPGTYTGEFGDFTIR